MNERASIFDTEPDFDVSGFSPKKEERGGEASPAIVRAVSEAAKFPSREPVAMTIPASEEPDPSRREPRRYRTGRNVQLNLKVRAKTVESFYKLADQNGWVLGETLERAVEALSRELAGAD